MPSLGKKQMRPSLDYSQMQAYPAVEQPVRPSSYTSLLDLIEASFTYEPERVAAILRSERLSYFELDRFSLNLATWFQSQGLKPGDRVAVLLPNLLQYPVIAAGIFRAGLVLVNINPACTTSEIAQQFRVVRPHCIMSFGSALDRLLGCPLFGAKCVVYTEYHDLFGVKASVAARLLGVGSGASAASKLSKFLPVHRFSKVIGTKASAYQRPNLGFDDLAMLQFTGGTTGFPKAAMITHGNLISNLMQCSEVMGELLDPSQRKTPDLVLAALPLYHIFSFAVSLLMCWQGANTALLVDDPRNVDNMIRLLKKHPVGVFVGGNSLFAALIDQPEFEYIDFSALRVTIGGAMPIKPEVADRWHQVSGLPISQGYGLTETSPVVSLNSLVVPKYNGTVGTPMPDTDVRIVLDNGEEAATGDAGEIWVRGPQVIKGYFGGIDDGECFTPDGYFRTGDIGSMDSRGFLRILDRKKDMINVSGFNVYPTEIEECLERHDMVDAAGVIGVADERSGERPVAFIVPADSKLTVEELRNYVTNRLVSYKHPVDYRFVDELPKSQLGKLKRTELKKML